MSDEELNEKSLQFSEKVEKAIEQMMAENPEICRKDFEGMCCDYGYVPKSQIKIKLQHAANRSNQAASKFITELMYQGYKKEDLLPLIPELSEYLNSKGKDKDEK